MVWLVLAKVQLCAIWDTHLPTPQLQEAIRAEIKGMSKEELLRVFPDYTEAEARKRKEEYIDMVVRMLKPISMHSAIKEITQEPTKLSDSGSAEYLSNWTANIRELIPKGHEVGKEFYKLVVCQAQIVG